MSGVTVRVDGAIAVVAFDNPARRNALTLAMAQDAVDTLGALADDERVRVVILRGAGEDAFMSGADIGEQCEEHQRAAFLDAVEHLIGTVSALTMPCIALVHGFCLGAGVAIAAQADLRVASAASVFGVPAARLGLGFPFIEVARLTALVGPGAAADLLLTGRRATVAEAAAWGFVQAVHPVGELDAETTRVAEAIAANAPLSLRAAKRAVRVASEGAQAADLAEVDRLVAACLTSRDYAEGRDAFFEKRAPRFIGR